MLYEVITAMIEAEEDEEPPGGYQPPGGFGQEGIGPKPVLLHGVTGSGKTEIYMRAIEFALLHKQRAIVLA